ncbi:MAG: glycosyltransferase [Bacteroidales bacterium]|nr:glycosyltransferase [Bacteroidales bacterium]
MSKICIVIPFYNEANRIQHEEFISFLENEKEYYLMLVNDGSTDSTLEELNKLQSAKPDKISIYSLEANSGKAEAVRQGIQKAWRWKDFDFFGYMDADLATPLSEAPYLVSYFDDYNIQFVIGSRVKLYGWDIKRSLKRHYLGRVFATIVGNTFGLKIYDTQCGAKFFCNCMAQDLFKDPFVSKWFFDIELFIRFRKKWGAIAFQERMIEVPLRHWEEKGESKLKLKDFLHTPLELRRIKRSYS